MINFLLALFEKIIYLSVVATIVGYIILLLKKVIRKRLSSNANYLIWLVFFVALVFPISLPSVVSIYNYVDISKIDSDTTNMMLDFGKQVKSNKNLEENVIDSVHENNSEIFNSCITIKEILAFIWLIVFIIIFKKKLTSYLAISKGIENSYVTDERVISLLENCKRRLNITKDIKIVNQDIASKPATIGIFNVKILATDFFLKLDNVALGGILLHELSHYKRKDNVMNFIILILKSAYWFDIFLYPIFKSIRNDMELATDEIAVGKMDSEELRVYCKSMIVFSSNDYSEAEAILGVSPSKKTLEKRISMISLNETFEKNAKMIFVTTFFIIVFLCLTFYPSSYGMNKIPRLYLKLKNGNKVEATRIENEDFSDISEIKLSGNQEVKLAITNHKSSDSIFYNVVDLQNMKVDEEINNILFWKIFYFESGEYIYKFILIYGDNKSANYAIKIIVE